MKRGRNRRLFPRCLPPQYPNSGTNFVSPKKAIGPFDSFSPFLQKGKEGRASLGPAIDFLTSPSTPHHYRPLPTTTVHHPSLPTTTHRYPQLTNATHQKPTIHHDPMLPTTTHHYPTQPTTTHYYPPLPIATNHYPQLSTSPRPSPSHHLKVAKNADSTPRAPSCLRKS